MALCNQNKSYFMNDTDIKKLPLKEVLVDSWKYCTTHGKIAFLLSYVKCSIISNYERYFARNN